MAENIADALTGSLLTVNPDGSVNVSGSLHLIGSITIGSVSANVDSMYQVSGNTYITPPINVEGGGKVGVGTTAVAMTFAGLTSSIILSADTGNNKQIYVGKSDVLSGGGNALTFLEAGESVALNYNDATNSLFVISESGTQNVFKGALL